MSAIITKDSINLREAVSQIKNTSLDNNSIGTLVQAYDANTTKNDTANTFTATQTWGKGADVASASALTLGSDGNYFDITGTTTITSIGTIGVGTVIKLHFDGALTLTHHATDLVLPGGANITTAAGDEAEFVEYATGDWRCTNYNKANGEAVIGGTGSMELLATVNAVGASTIDFDGYFTSSYDQYRIITNSIFHSTALNILAQVFIANVIQTGSNYDSSSHYRTTGSVTHTVNSGVGATSMTLTRAINPTTSNVTNLNIIINDPLQTATRKMIVCDTQVLDNSTGGGEFENVIGTYNNSNSAITGVRILTSTGVITGDFYLYGVKNG